MKSVKLNEKWRFRRLPEARWEELSTPLPEEGWEWALDHAGTIALAAFALVSAALVMTGLKAVSPENGKKRKEK